MYPQFKKKLSISQFLHDCKICMRIHCTESLILFISLELLNVKMAQIRVFICIGEIRNNVSSELSTNKFRKIH